MVYPLLKIWAFPLIRSFIREIRGIENIPLNSNFIVVSNHEKRIDPLYVAYPIIKKLNKKVHFIALPKLWFLGEKICSKWAGCIPLFNPQQAYNEAKKCLLKKNIVGIFPEGGYKNNHAVPKFKTGAVRLAIETGLPILPIGLRSSYMPGLSIVNIGAPVYVNANKGSVDGHTRAVMEQVRKLREG